MITGGASEKIVLVVVSIGGQFAEMLKIARLIRDSGVYRPVVYFNIGVPPGSDILATLGRERIEAYDFRRRGVISFAVNGVSDALLVNDGMPNQGVPNSVVGFKGLVRARLPNLWRAMTATKRYLTRQINWYARLPIFVLTRLRRIRIEKGILAELDPVLIVLAEDSVDYCTPELIRSAHERGCKTIVFPYSLANALEFAEDAYHSGRFADEKLVFKMITAASPKWTYLHRGRRVVKSRPELIIGSHFLGISPPNPWVMNSGSSDLIAVESDRMRDYYCEAGIPIEQMKVVGFPSLDDLAITLKNRDSLRRQLLARNDHEGRLEDVPWVVCAVPVSQWPRPAYGFSSYDDFLAAFFSAMKGMSGYHVVYKFHPRVPSDEIAQIEKKFGVKGERADTAELIPLADIYIASVSATIRWAVCCGIPVLNYDLYGYDYVDFQRCPGVLTVRSFEEFRESLERLTGDKSFFATVASAQKAISEYWGAIDGLASERILALFKHYEKSSINQ